MKCTECGNAMTKTVGDHHYIESGLDNVMLQNVTKYECPSCGAERVSIGAIAPLHRAIAKSLAEKQSRLLPAEVAFLRDYLELSNKEFAEVMGVSPEQASRWTSSEPIGVPAERFLRVLAMLGPDGVAGRKKGADRVHKAKVRPGRIAAEPLYGVSAEDLVTVIEHLPSKDTPAKEIEIGLRRTSADGWKSRDRRTN